jgi:hypothetical protein
MLKSLRDEGLQRGELVKLARNVLPEQARFFQEHEREHNEIRLRQLLNEMEQR